MDRRKAARRLKDIRLVVFDFDGVFTDNTVYVFEDGREAVRCSRADGLGLKKLRDLRMDMMILSTEANKVVTARAKKLKLSCTQNIPNKLLKLQEIAKEKDIRLSHIAYVGNDINDIDCLASVGLPIVVVDAFPEVKKLGMYVTKTPGGKGAVREVCDWMSGILSK